MFQRVAATTSQSNRLWQRLAIGTNWPILASVVLLSAIGLVTVWADSKPDGSVDWRKQLVYIVMGVVCMAAFQAVNYQKIGRYAWGFYLSALLLVIYTLIGKKFLLPGVPRLNGACKWIVLGSTTHSFSLQPAELMKVGFVMMLARYLRFRSNYRTFGGLVAPMALALVPTVVILRQPDLGTSFIFIPTLFAMLFVAGAKINHLLIIALIGIILAPIGWMAGKDKNGIPHSHLPLMRYLPELVSAHQRQCILDIFSGDDPTVQEHGGYQQKYALAAMGSGGFVGRGPGKIIVGRHVPESDSDMIFSLIGEQFGLIGTIVVLIAYLTLFAAGVEIAGNTREPFGRLVALGVVAMIAAQTFSNLMVATRLMPVTGVPLPFISTGGSSIIASFMSAGLLLNIGQNRPIVMAKDAFEFE